MSEEARVELTGDTTKLDQKIEQSARKQVQLAKLTANEIEQLNSSLDAKLLRDFQRMGARGEAAMEQTSRGVFKMKEEMKLFGGISVRAGAGASAALLTVVSAAKAVGDEVERAKRLLASLTRTGADQTINVVNSLSRLGLSDVGGIVDASRTAQGPVKQEDLDKFLVAMGESGLNIDSDRAKDLVRVFARNASVLGDGGGLLAAQALFPDRTPDALADAVVSYRKRTGSELSLDALRDQDGKIIAAQEKVRLTSEKSQAARTGGSLNALRAAEDAAQAARLELADLQARRSSVWQLAQPEQGAVAEAMIAGGSGFLQANVVRMGERRTEVEKNRAADSVEGVRALMQEFQGQRTEVIRARENATGGRTDIMRNVIRNMRDSGIVTGMEQVITGDTAGARSAASLTDRIAGELSMQTMLLQKIATPHQELRPDAQSEF